MMKRKLLGVLLSAAMAAALVTGCGGGSTPTAAESTEAPKEAETTKAAEEEKASEAESK